MLIELIARTRLGPERDLPRTSFGPKKDRFGTRIWTSFGPGLDPLLSSCAMRRRDANALAIIT
jgi:hypothetical protein